MQATPPALPALSEPPRALRVLVVEDDPEALSLTVEMLQLLGHWATGVKSAEVAKDRFTEGAFDVLLTDIGLPALSGYDLVDSLLERHQLQVIFATGQQRPVEPRPGTFWLQKPFGVEQLEQALAQAASCISRDSGRKEPERVLPVRQQG
ncbi:MAG: response regulator [Variovorax sp.]